MLGLLFDEWVLFSGMVGLGKGVMSFRQVLMVMLSERELRQYMVGLHQMVRAMVVILCR